MRCSRYALIAHYQSFQLFLLYADETSEAHFVALARQLANATMLHGPGFSIVQAIDADPMVTLHVAGTQKVLEYWEDPSNDKRNISVFYKGLMHLLVTVSPKSAMQMYVKGIDTAMQQFISASLRHISSLKLVQRNGMRSLRMKNVY